MMVALLAGGVAALLTSLGAVVAVPLYWFGGRVDRLLDAGLGFSSGVMLVASFTSLLLPAIESWGVWLPLLGFLLGALVMGLVHRLVPHEHLLKGVVDGPAGLGSKLEAAVLVALAIIIHNLPEGLAIGFASLYDPRAGWLMGLAIGVQDVPEGLAVTLPLLAVSRGWARPLMVGVLSGVSEWVAAVAAALLGVEELLPVLMGFGAGAMIFVTIREAVPEAFRGGYEDVATVGFLAGFSLMLVLDTLLS